MRTDEITKRISDRLSIAIEQNIPNTILSEVRSLIEQQASTVVKTVSDRLEHALGQEIPKSLLVELREAVAREGDLRRENKTSEEAFTREATTLRQKITDLEKALNASESRIDEFRKEKAVDAEKANSDRLEADRVKIFAQNLKDRMERQTREMANLTSERAELARLIETLRSDLAGSRSNSNELKETTDQLKNELDRVRTLQQQKELDAQRLEIELEHSRTHLLQLKVNEEELHKASNELRQRNQTLVQRVTSLEHENENLRTEKQYSTDRVAIQEELQSELDEAGHMISELKIQKEKLTTELEGMAKAATDLKNQNEILRDKLDTTREHYDTFRVDAKSELNLLRSKMTQLQQEKALLSAKIQTAKNKIDHQQKLLATLQDHSSLDELKTLLDFEEILLSKAAQENNADPAFTQQMIDQLAILKDKKKSLTEYANEKKAVIQAAREQNVIPISNSLTNRS